MMCKTSYEFHHNFPKLAEESGFTFNTHRPRIHIDWNKIREDKRTAIHRYKTRLSTSMRPSDDGISIRNARQTNGGSSIISDGLALCSPTYCPACLLDVESLIRERKFILVEQHLNDILDCVLESEFDVRILDEGVVKLFRLAQLAVEYQQFCRHYLDRSVFVLKDEIAALAQELDTAKKEVKDKDEEIKKIRKKSKYGYRVPLPFGNDNIATMILRTLSNKNEIFSNTSNTNALQYNKCNYCDKVFLNQLYLSSHMSRRHPGKNDTKMNSTEVQTNIDTYNGNEKLSNELSELKSKLKEMEAMIKDIRHDEVKQDTNNVNKNKIETTSHEVQTNHSKNDNDAEVSKNHEQYLLEKFEVWKRDEQEKYSKEINMLRTQIVETVQAMGENQKPSDNYKLIEELHATIKQQGSELLKLKAELTKKNTDTNNVHNKEVEAQMSFWANRAELQTRQYDELVKKLNEVAKEAQESRALAETERNRALQLQTLLEKEKANPKPMIVERNERPTQGVAKPEENEIVKTTRKRVPDSKTLEELHRKAQELLSRTSLTSSDVSNISSGEEASSSTEHKQVTALPIERFKEVKHSKKIEPQMKNIEQNVKKKNNNTKSHGVLPKKQNTTKKKLDVVGHVLTPPSPLKVVRAKITEEVNSRLATAGVDPLSSRLPHSVFRKTRMLLQQQQELKYKKNPKSQQIRNSILTYLDAQTSEVKIKATNESVSPSKVTKSFSLSSMLSNVKSKALSFVKSNEMVHNIERRNENSEALKGAMSSLKTPPISEHSTPTKESKTKINENRDQIKTSKKIKAKTKAEEETVKKNKVPDTVFNSNLTDSESEDYSPKIKSLKKTVDILINSPARRPVSANSNYKISTIVKDEPKLSRVQSVNTLTANTNTTVDIQALEIDDNSSNDIESLIESPLKKAESEDNLRTDSSLRTKGVLKHASSTNSLNKKKVLFDMDAIQVKSVSASPSQSITEKSNSSNIEKYELGLVNLEDQEWDISSIENEPLNKDTKIHVKTGTSPKIEELKKNIESQLARRNENPSSALVGSVDVLGIPKLNSAGSNTSLGSSLFDLDEPHYKPRSQNAFVKPKKILAKDDSDIDVSEFSVEGLSHKRNMNESF